MGGDNGPRVVVPAALRVLSEYKGRVRLILVGDPKLLRRSLRLLRAPNDENLIIHPASEVVTMDEPPAHAVRHKRDSSMRVALNLVKDGTAQACVSAGNTGALMAMAHFVLKAIPMVERPALITKFPCMSDGIRGTRVLDLGANIDATPERLFQFAVMGSVLTAAVEDIDRPKVGLLNIGVEQIKGNEQVKRAAELLQACKAINYIGYVEGDDFFKGLVDVVVCDGFTGNCALKASEGSAKLIYSFVKSGFSKGILTKIAALLIMPILKNIRKKIDPARYNGASLLGLNGIVIKSHGNTSVIGFANAIEEGIREVEKNVPQRIREQVSLLLQEKG